MVDLFVDDCISTERINGVRSRVVDGAEKVIGRKNRARRLTGELPCGSGDGNVSPTEDGLQERRELANIIERPVK